MTLLNDSAVDTLAKRIRMARLISGLKQSDIADAIGVARSTVNEWEAGRSEPSATRLFALARTTGQALDWFADYRSEGWGFESLRAHNCVETVDAQFWRIVGCQAFPDTLFSFPCEVAR